MGWSNSTFQLLIITASPSGFSGLFVYSPAPGPGNLIASIAATAGTDPYGNGYLSGITSYVSGQTAQLTGGQVNVSNSLDNNPGSLSATSSFGGLAQLSSPQTGAGDTSFIASLYSKNGHAGGPFMQVSNPVVATAATGGPEKWHVIGAAGEPAFGVGFGAAGFVGAIAPAFQLEPINGGRVRLRGDVALTANQVQGATIVTLPAGYQTATNQQFFNTVNNLSGYSISTGSLVTLAGGIVGINCAGTNGNFVSLDGTVIELD